ncbi:MAG: NAD+ synthase [Dehalococcoidia bacterium]|nr:NAD+ synthase [Dehalococcoidia bacterium]|tara:strand:- start:1426 stop:3111 length:1686 start_codon:yes stop_codon:yes gene_type:complete
MQTLRIAMAQINPVVGDIQGNTDKIKNYIKQAQKENVDVITFPELALTGYPPEDLLFKTHFINDIKKHLEEVTKSTQGITAIIGLAREENGLLNSAAVIYDRKIINFYDKKILPNYGVFDEKRYFISGKNNPVYLINGITVGINICEDIWFEDGPTKDQADLGAQLILNINGSPFDTEKRDIRENMLKERALHNNLYISYTNMVGGQDELVFDGGSVLLNPAGEIISRGKAFEEDLIITDLYLEETTNFVESNTNIFVSNTFKNKNPRTIPDNHIVEISKLEQIHKALILGTRDYVNKSGFTKVILGLSGGIDSALTCYIAVKAFGKENVLGVIMPSRFSSEGSITDSQLLANNLGIDTKIIPIEPAYSSFLDMLSESFEGTSVDVAEENLQARIRGNILMALSNKFNWITLITGNKSEMATGYSTLYGDMAGGFAVLKDVPKTLVYELCRYINTLQDTDLIPETIITKPPSAELREDQKDEDSLPPYDILDAILKYYVEEDRSFQEIVDLGYDEAVVKRTTLLLDRSEYKRKQSPPGVKITPRNFGRDRRIPLINKYKNW